MVYWGMAPHGLIGHSFGEVVEFDQYEGDEWEVLARRGRSGPYLVRDSWGTEWTLLLTSSAGQVMAYLESASEGVPEEGIRSFASAIDRMTTACSEQEVWDRGCERVRRWLGAENVLVFRVGSDHAEVLAASRVDAGGSVVGSVFDRVELGFEDADLRGMPSSVSLYDVDSADLRIVPETDSSGRPWATTGAPYHAMPELHRAIMRQYGKRSRFTIVPNNPEGDRSHVLIAYSAKPVAVNAFVRLGCEILTQFMCDRVESMRREADLNSLLAQATRIPDLVSRTRPLSESLTGRSADGFSLLDLFPAAGVVIGLDGEVRSVGDVTAEEAATIADSAGEWLSPTDMRGLQAVDDLSRMYPEHGRRLPSVSGVLGAALGAEGSFICWIRRQREVVKRSVIEIDTARTVVGVSAYPTEETVSISVPWSESDERAARMLVQAVENQLLSNAQARLAELALVDSLTGLPNRRLLVDRIAQSIRRRQRGKSFVLFFVDLNEFKAVNDTMGHMYGDRLLVAVADRLRTAVRSDDTVARLGGDEFVVLCDDVGPIEQRAIEGRIRGCFDAPFDIDGRAVRMRAAVGATTGSEADSVESLLDRADASMYSSKSRMRSAVAL